MCNYFFLQILGCIFFQYLTIKKNQKERTFFLNFLKLERTEYQDIISCLSDELEKYKTEDGNLQSQIESLENENKSLEKEIDELFSVIIKPRNDRHEESFICKKKDIFQDIENKFYQLHEEYRNRQLVFEIGNRIIEKEKTLEENNIRDNVTIKVREIE